MQFETGTEKNRLEMLEFKAPRKQGPLWLLGFKRLNPKLPATSIMSE